MFACYDSDARGDSIEAEIRILYLTVSTGSRLMWLFLSINLQTRGLPSVTDDVV